MSNHHWSKFWWQDWRNDAGLRLCSLAAQGLWMQLLCLMAESERPGYLLIAGEAPDWTTIGRLMGAKRQTIGRLMDALERHNVYSKENDVIFSRRMVKDVQASDIGRESANKRYKGNGQSPTGLPNGSPTGHPNAKKQKQMQKHKGGKNAQRSSTRTRVRASATPLSVIDQIRKDWNLGSFLVPLFDDDGNPNPKALQ